MPYDVPQGKPVTTISILNSCIHLFSKISTPNSKQSYKYFYPASKRVNHFQTAIIEDDTLLEEVKSTNLLAFVDTSHLLCGNITRARENAHSAYILLV